MFGPCGTGWAGEAPRGTSRVRSCAWLALGLVGRFSGPDSRSRGRMGVVWFVGPEGGVGTVSGGTLESQTNVLGLPNDEPDGLVTAG